MIEIESNNFRFKIELWYDCNEHLYLAFLLKAFPRTIFSCQLQCCVLDPVQCLRLYLPSY